jgi:hypothetical protein
MRPVPDATVEENRSSGYVFPANIIRVGFTTNGLGYGMNQLFSRRIPIFWGGHVETRHGMTIDYQRNVFHTKKVFAFDLGASGSLWLSDSDSDSFGTLSGYPMFRFFFVRSRTADLYFNYFARRTDLHLAIGHRQPGHGRGSRSRISWASHAVGTITGSTRKSAFHTTPTATVHGEQVREGAADLLDRLYVLTRETLYHVSGLERSRPHA